jgi:hypothetical protein
MGRSACNICGDLEPFHVHDGDKRIEDYFTVGRGHTDFSAAKAWKARALAAEAAREHVRQELEAECHREAMELVRQEDPQGCGVAVLAMLTDQTYAKVKTDLEADEWVKHGGDWTENGIAQPVIERYLMQRRRFITHVYSKRDAGGGPPSPFAPRHYAIVKQPSNNSHFVAVNADGSVLDPLRDGVHTFTDWDVVNCLVGVVPHPEQVRAEYRQEIAKDWTRLLRAALGLSGASACLCLPR